MAEIDWKQIREEALADFKLDVLPTTLKLPALPHAVTLYIQRSNDPNASLKELAAIVETDTGLTVELLRYVNSAYVGLRSKAKSVLQAIGLLGSRQSQLFLVTTGMQAAVRSRQSKLINQQCFWNSSLQRAIFAREVAKLLNVDGDIAFAGAVLQDFLLPVLTNELYEPYFQFTENRSHQPAEIVDFERKQFHWDHAVAGASLAVRWQLPDELVCCVLFHHLGLKVLVDPRFSRTPIAAVALSALLPDQLRQSYQGLEQLMILETKWPAFHLKELVELVDAKHEELGFGVDNSFPLSRRCKPILEAQNALEPMCVG